mmetsp:Transcript_27813/g.50542  ORF Transcript_27813/g.50542 Transcript_27813/m.50542 type:complete len:91 (+) Transcript_27813:1057-1329(+)
MRESQNIPSEITPPTAAFFTSRNSPSSSINIDPIGATTILSSKMTSTTHGHDQEKECQQKESLFQLCFHEKNMITREGIVIMKVARHSKT